MQTPNTLDSHKINTHQHRWYYFDMYHRFFIFSAALKTKVIKQTAKIQTYCIVFYTQPNTHIHAPYTHTQTQFTTQRFVTGLFTPMLSQVMDSQMNSKLLYKILESESNVALI